MRVWRPFRDVRTRLLAIVLIAVAVALGAATYGFNLLFEHTSARDADTLLRTRADSERSLLALSGGRIQVPETSDDRLGDSNLWIFDRAGGVVEAPRRRPDLDAAARSLAGGPAGFLNVPSADTRLYARPVQARGQRLGTIVIGLSLAPYDQTRQTALIGSFALAGVLLTLVGIAAYLLLRSALRPVSEMTEQAAAWSEQDLDRRFELGEPHDELTRLAATLDALLDRIAASLRHERRFSAEVSHELRTPLATLLAEAEVALRRERPPAEYRETLESIVRNASHLARTLETLVVVAQQEIGPRGIANGYSAAQEIVETCAGMAAERGVDVALEQPRGAIRVGADEDVVERILQPVVENACRYGKSSVRISMGRSGSTVSFVVEDDGPGVQAGERETIFEPGARGSAGLNDGSGAGLGLALARRLARASAGDVRAESGGGGRFVVTLPAA